jgi:hypothetical protein
MTDKAGGNRTEQPKPRRVGCAVVLLAVVAVVVGAGFFLGRREDASKSPCERYAETMAGALDNCSSGRNRNSSYHVAACERSVNPSEACLERLKSLPCDQLDLAPGSAGPVCRK